MAKILYIEDEPDQIDMLRTRLEGAGFQLVTARDGEEGLKMAGEEKPDLILLDLFLPKISGLKLGPLLRKIPGIGEIPIVAITASGSSHLTEQCAAAGINEYILKPYDSSFVVERITALLAQAQS
ncbi:MAG: response regulator [Candidatus Omnitrophota bacterium]